MTLKRDQIDFHEVRPEHLAIHQRLLNWAKWCSSGIRNVSVHPMFKHYRHGYEEASAGSGVVGSVSIRPRMMGMTSNGLGSGLGAGFSGAARGFIFFAPP